MQGNDITEDYFGCIVKNGSEGDNTGGRKVTEAAAEIIWVHELA